VSAVEVAVACVFGLLGVRSLIHWLRRPVDVRSRRERLLFAVFVASRAGIWFALMGLFLLYATVDTEGRAFTDDAARFNWYFIVLAVPAALQFVTSFLLGRDPRIPPSDGGPGG
jgi:hypothetical protein